MKGLLVGLLIVAVIVGGIFFMGMGMKNQFVQLDENANAAWANVDTVLQRRYDLIPNLVNTVKGFAAQEKGVLEEVTRLRSQWGEAKTVDQRAEAATQMEGALGRLMVVVERYPDLKSNQNFLALQDELAGTENRISVERRRYNDAIREYNTAIRRFPASIFAGFFDFNRRNPFEAGDAARVAPTVQF
ncbi:MAG TPA: LemA family protein [Verrucomicrobia bacterium]|nr:MAG: LemA family protein [Lentisphaerae bacterium GWF2_57_35]HBA83892.1 LemA family protein [Verrucomicrobiota bacterium]